MVEKKPPATLADASAANGFPRAAFVLSVLVGAFLLFMVEPLIGKIVTPKFGGISAVWSMCMLFFQTTLLIGYAITYLLSKLRPRVQAIVYILVMLASLPLIQIPAPVAWEPGNVDAPIRNLLLLLANLPFALVGGIFAIVLFSNQDWPGTFSTLKG